MLPIGNVRARLKSTSFSKNVAALHEHLFTEYDLTLFMVIHTNVCLFNLDLCTSRVTCSFYLRPYRRLSYPTRLNASYPIILPKLNLDCFNHCCDLCRWIRSRMNDWEEFYVPAVCDWTLEKESVCLVLRTSWQIVGSPLICCIRHTIKWAYSWYTETTTWRFLFIAFKVVIWWN